MRILRALMLCALLGFAWGACHDPRFARPVPIEAAKTFFDDPILVAAHRGGAGLWPENTLFALTNAHVRWPGAVLEVDVRMTADGHPVLLHDASVDRTTDGSGLVREKSLDELREMDAAYWFDPEGDGSFPLRGRGIGIPTLEEVLRALPGARIQIEFKQGRLIAEHSMKIIHDQNAVGRVLLCSFDPFIMDRVRRIAPEVATCYDRRTGIQLLRFLRRGRMDTHRRVDDVLSLDASLMRRFQLSRDDVQTLRESGILFQIHTVNTPEEMRYWLDFGVDSIITDHPDRLAKVVAERHASN